MTTSYEGSIQSFAVEETNIALAESEVQVSRWRTVGKAVLQEFTSIAATFKQGRSDYRQLRSYMREHHRSESSFSPKEWAMLKLWNYAILPSYQVGDDIPGLAAYLALREATDLPTAWLGIAASSTIVATGLGLAQRKVEQREAQAMGVEIVEDDTSLIHDTMDASVNSAPWGVLRHANAHREEGDPISLSTKRRVMEMAATYGVVNTTIYSASELIPKLNSWGSFVVMLTGMMIAKGAARGIQEHRAQLEDFNER